MSDDDDALRGTYDLHDEPQRYCVTIITAVQSLKLYFFFSFFSLEPFNIIKMLTNNIIFNGAISNRRVRALGYNNCFFFLRV